MNLENRYMPEWKSRFLVDITFIFIFGNEWKKKKNTERKKRDCVHELWLILLWPCLNVTQSWYDIKFLGRPASSVVTRSTSTRVEESRVVNASLVHWSATGGAMTRRRSHRIGSQLRFNDAAVAGYAERKHGERGRGCGREQSEPHSHSMTQPGNLPLLHDDPTSLRRVVVPVKWCHALCRLHASAPPHLHSYLSSCNIRITRACTNVTCFSLLKRKEKKSYFCSFPYSWINLWVEANPKILAAIGLNFFARI